MPVHKKKKKLFDHMIPEAPFISKPQNRMPAESSFVCVCVCVWRHGDARKNNKRE